MTTIRIVLLLLVIPLFSNAQRTGNTKIIVTLADTTSILTRLVTHLYERGYLIEEKDEAIGFIETKSRPGKNNNGAYKITAQLNGNTIIFSSSMLSTQSKNKTFIEVKFGAVKGSPGAEAWRATEVIAKELGHNISYE